MRLLVIGGTGGCGRAVVHAGSARGHDIASLGRRGLAGPAAPRVTVWTGDAAESDLLRAAIATQDAIVICLGGAPPRRGERPFARIVERVLEAAGQCDVRRILYLSCLGVDARRGVGPWWFERFLLPIVWRERARDHAAAEAVLAASDTAWTICRPAPLHDGPALTRYRIFSRPELVPNLRALPITRADVAHFLLDEAERAEFVGQKVLLCY